MARTKKSGQGAKFIFVYITCPNLKSARGIAQSLLAEKLIACANIFPRMQSIYRWQGKPESATEAVLILKTLKAKFKKIERRVTKLHPYEVPCILNWELKGVNAPYAQWLTEQF